MRSGHHYALAAAFVRARRRAGNEGIASSGRNRLPGWGKNVPPAGQIRRFALRSLQFRALPAAL